MTIRKLEVQFFFLHILQDFLLNWICLGLGLLHACFEEGCAKWDYYLRSLVEPYFETLSIKQIIVCISKHVIQRKTSAYQPPHVI